MAFQLVAKDELFPIEKYSAADFRKENSISFVGSPSKHPYETDKFILIIDPLSNHTDFIEFQKDDVIFIEDIPSIYSGDEGDNVSFCRVWIKKGAYALKMQPFIVDKISYKF